MSRLAEATAAGAPSAGSGAGRPRVGAALQGVALAVGLALLVGGFALVALDYRPYRVPTASMTPTIGVGDTVLARKVSGGSVGRGDIVVFQDPAWGSATLVKRVVAVGGDTVACSGPGGRLTINGTPVDEPYLASGGAEGQAAFTAKVPAGRLFLLGDSRVGSLDSRAHLDVDAGTVPASDVLARVEAIAWPSDQAKLLRRTSAFDGLGGPVAGRPGPLVPATWASVSGAVLIVLISLTGPVAALARRIRRRS
ncbi:signal peptidase I [Kitasatospora sp. NPDC052896]|uniref:signal peptidase I n=1 Tax=Kitasatospora sp. NPDC052896 TaxID=3364061 RepID=UPI0037C9C134